MGSSRADLRGFPEEIRDEVGTALFEVQLGGRPQRAKPLRGFGSAGVQEIRAAAGGIYRVVYTVTLPDAVYVLHAFQKKSTVGIKTSQRDLELVRQRLREAQRLSSDRIGMTRKASHER